MKYEDAIGDEDNEAHNIILEQIRPDSKILEFGPAGGRMTRILKEKFHGEVYIVEYEEAAYSKAMLYAADGVCGDIESLLWKEKWKNIQFDYIIFADVLEHLREPLKILRETESLLAEVGSVLISVPNIAHNDILIKLVNNHFDYTDIGILDNTHLHFWAEENLKEFETDTGYQICSIRYKTIPTRTTEQFRNSESYLSRELQILLPKRRYGEVYQFILTLKKKAYAAEHCIENKVEESPEGYLNGRLYYDRGNGFSQEDSRTAVAFFNKCMNRYEVSIEEILEKDVSRLRYDPLEGQSCVVYELDARLDGNKCVACEEGVLCQGDVRLLLSDDPQLIFEVENGKQFRLRLEFSVEKKAVETICQQNEIVFQAKIAELLLEKQGFIDKCKALEEEKRQLNHRLEQLERIKIVRLVKRFYKI